MLLHNPAVIYLFDCKIAQQHSIMVFRITFTTYIYFIILNAVGGFLTCFSSCMQYWQCTVYIHVMFYIDVGQLLCPHLEFRANFPKGTMKYILSILFFSFLLYSILLYSVLLRSILCHKEVILPFQYLGPVLKIKIHPQLLCCLQKKKKKKLT